MTITHLFGQTVIKEPPKRVVSAGYTEQDDLLAVGVVPIAVTNWWGDQPFAVWPWAQPKLGDAQPVVLNLDNGIPVDQIAGLKPDLIVAINAGVDATPTRSCRRSPRPSRRVTATRSSSRGRTRPPRSARRCSRPTR